MSRLLVLALFFFAGILLGQVFSSRVPDTTGDELARYLKDFLKVGEEDPSPRAALSAAVLYFRYPLAAFLLGFASIGVLALPLVTGAFGGFLSFSVCCFTASFGPDGVLLALAVFGLRCVVTLPCYFLLAVPALSAAVLYFRYPLAAFLLGFASIGVLALPLVTGAFGGFLSFSVCCFTASFGPDGVLLALAVFGLRCVVTLPCYFLLAVPALERSTALACLSLGGGRRAGPALYGREWWGRLAVVAGVLLAGVCADLMLTPWFLRQLLERMLIG